MALVLKLVTPVCSGMCLWKSKALNATSLSPRIHVYVHNLPSMSTCTTCHSCPRAQPAIHVHVYNLPFCQMQACELHLLA